MSTNGTKRSKSASSSLHPILGAAKNGDFKELGKLLNLKSKDYDPSFLPIYPEDYEYKYSDLLRSDGEGRTALQLACYVGKHERALKCVQLLCESIQVLSPESEDDDDERDKLKELLEYKRDGAWKQTPIHFAIENKATEVIAYLLDHNVNVAAKSVGQGKLSSKSNSKENEALTLICQKVPDALIEVYNNAIQLSEDHKKIELDLAVLIGVRNQKPSTLQQADGDREQSPGINMERESDQETYQKIPVEEDGGDTELWRETEYLSYILEADNWGAELLLHPLVKFFLQRKWDKVRLFFWIPFCLQILWLFLYSAAFVQLHVYTESMTENDTDTQQSQNDTNIMSNIGGKIENDKDPSETEEPPPLPFGLALWSVLFVIAILGAVKELYIGYVLQKHYLTFEKLARVSFILLFFIQFGLLTLGYLERAATISVVGIAFSTTLMIFQLGKLTYFGQQVAAMEKVVSSFIPHMPLFFVWFLGFCLIFWALFYKSNESSVIVLLAIVAAMGTGEINAKDHLEESLKRSVEFHDLISVFCLMLFIITIVTLYFNLLIGYAVTDIRELKKEAEAYEMSNRLSTIITTESFLLSKVGRWVVRLFQCGKVKKGHYMDSIYVIPPSTFQTSAKLSLKFDDVPPEILKKFKDIAFDNIMKVKERNARHERMLEQMQQKGV